MVRISFLRRLLGLDHARKTIELPVFVAPPGLPPPQPPPQPAAVIHVACPYCGVVLDPPPDRTRMCRRCRCRIVVRHAEGRAIYLTEAAVAVFEAQRQHDLDQQTWARERRRWLQLAQFTGASADRRQRLAAEPLTESAVQAARSLYLAAAERAVRAARSAKHWDDVARIRRRQAGALFEEAGSKPPPPEDIVALHREGVTATLRAIAPISREVELVGASCCPACRADSDRIFKVADELRTPRLPHAGCPRGICACDWWPALRKPATKRRRRRTVTAAKDTTIAPAARETITAAFAGPTD